MSLQGQLASMCPQICWCHPPRPALRVPPAPTRRGRSSHPGFSLNFSQLVFELPPLPGGQAGGSDEAPLPALGNPSPFSTRGALLGGLPWPPT